MFIVKVPGINGEKSKGCEKSGNAILKIFKEEIFSNEQGKAVDFSRLDLEEIHLDNGNLENSNKLVYNNSFESFEEKPRIIFLGGDHSASYSITRAFFDYCDSKGKKPCLIIFDAHSDLMPCADDFPDNRNWLRKLIEDGFPAESILLVGVRNIDGKEAIFMKEKNIRCISINTINENIQEACDIIMEFANGKELYVSIDMDVVDPAFAPAVAYEEPGGLTSRQIIYLIQRINKIKNLRALDITEVNETRDASGMTIKLGAKLLSEII